MSARHFPSLDPLDIRIMGELESDARQTYKDLAVKLGVSRPTITSRVRRLLDSGVIRIICWADPAALGYKFIVTLSIYAQPGRIADVADRLAAHAQVLHIHLCTGRFNIFAWAMFRDREDLSNFLLNELGSISGVLHVETMLTLQEVHISPRLLTDEKEPRHQENPSKELDDLDLKLIKELQMNARQKARHLARKLGVYESTILRRIQRLVNENIIQIITVIHPSSLGYEVIATICLKCNPDKVREIADIVASYRQVQYTSMCAGRYDIITWGVFRKLSDLRHFITVELGGIPGLRDTEAMINYKVVKLLSQLST
jgi:DNA-binding Lrp family transcriptional regulator